MGREAPRAYPSDDQLGGLVAKAGLIELADDYRAVLPGAMMAVADKLRSEDRDQAVTLWRRLGKRSFEAMNDPDD